MDFDALAYPDEFEIGGVQHKGRRDTTKAEVSIPYTNAPQVEIGEVVTQKSGPNLIELRVVDVGYLEGGSLHIGTKHPHILTLHVENITSARHQRQSSTSAITIGSISGQQVQVGNQNTQVTNITLSELVRQVSHGGDSEAKGLLRKLLENNTVAAIVGAGTTALLGGLTI